MDAQELRNLQEAYNQVHQLDEELTGTRREKAKKIIADPATPKSKRDALNRVLTSREGSTPHGQQPSPNIIGDGSPQKLPTKRGGGGIKGRAKVSTIGGSKTDQRRGNRATKKGGGEVENTRYDESFDLYDIILSHLLDEGYADTNKAALAIMANMSEEWRKEIMEFRIPPNMGWGRKSSGTAQGDFEAGGGLTKMQKTGMSRDQVIDQGKKNISNDPLSTTFSPTRHASDRSTPQGRERNDAYAKAGVKFPEDDERNRQNKLIYGQ